MHPNCSTRIILLSCTIAGCDERALGNPDTASAAARVPAAGRMPPRLAGYEQAQLSLAASIPGYAGGYYDERGNLHVLVTDLESSDRAKAVLEPVLRARGKRLSRDPIANPRLIMHRARYDYPQLLRWHHLARTIVPPMRGTSSLGIDITRNAVSVGVSSAALGSAVIDSLAAAGIPRDALRFDVMRPPVIGAAELVHRKP